MKRPNIKDSLGDIGVLHADEIYKKSPKLYSHIQLLDGYIDFLEERFSINNLGNTLKNVLEKQVSFDAPQEKIDFVLDVVSEFKITLDKDCLCSNEEQTGWVEENGLKLCNICGKSQGNY